MHSTNEPSLAYAYPRAHCEATSMAPPIPPPSLLAVGGYDAETLDALMLFHTSQPPAAVSVASVTLHIVHGQRYQQTPVTSARDEAARRAMHRVVQQRFVQRKKAEFEQLRRYARKIELQHRTLLLRAQADTLREERAWLEHKCDALDVPIDAECDYEDEDEQDGKGRDGHVPSPVGDADTIPTSYRRLFHFELSSD